MRIHQRLLALLPTAVLLLPSPVAALTSAEISCRDEMADEVSRYVLSAAKAMTSCHQRRSAGTRPLEVNCNAVDEADPAGKLGPRRAAARRAILAACSGADSLLVGDVACPDPAASSDNGGVSTGLDDFVEVGDCLIALAHAHAQAWTRDSQGNPPERLLDPLRKCQSKLGKGVSRLAKTIARERRRCQKAVDASGGGADYGCEGIDARGRIAKTSSRFADQMAAACPFSPEVIAKLDACAGDAESLIACAEASADTHVSELIRGVYEWPANEETTTTTTSTTTTTHPTVTTTTLPGTACGDTFPQCNGSCAAGTECVADGSGCNCVATGSGPCAPATIIRRIHAKYGPVPSVTMLSTGWSGSAHDVDIPDGTGDVIDVSCDENCENCEVSMNVLAGDPASNCRCTSNQQTTCTVINGSDPDSCGSLDPTCRCYFGAPLPLSSGGTPACVVNRIRGQYSGTMNLRTGEWSDRIRLASVVYLGLETTRPCPTCNGDPVPNDGVRGGTCSGGLGGGACDANGVHAAFGATSLDCLPTTAANISGTGLLIDLNSSTGSQSLAATLPCDTPSGELCPCRTCSGNGNLGCSSNAQCAAAGAGTCTVGGGAGVNLNACDNFECAPSGECATGPVDSYCDGALYPDGRGYVPCSGDSDCTASSAGTCNVIDLRRCFPDPISAVGDPDTYHPVDGSLFCIAATSNPTVNLAAGLPGPGKFLLDFDSDIRCQSDRNLLYEFPDGANCDAVSTTTTTLLPLPDCGDAVSPLCGGVCPPGQACADNGGTCACSGLPLPTCEDAVSPICGGVCADSDKICLDNAGTCECQVPTLPQCSGATSPVCGGLCPLGEVCTDVGGTCECGAPGVPQCGSALSPACAGLCDVGSACIDMGGSCGCLALPLPTCAEATTPLCVGTCSVGSYCSAVGSACQCTALPLP